MPLMASSNTRLSPGSRERTRLDRSPSLDGRFRRQVDDRIERPEGEGRRERGPVSDAALDERAVGGTAARFRIADRR